MSKESQARPGRPPEGSSGSASAEAGRSASVGAAASGGAPAETLSLSLHEHGIGFFLPPGAVLHASEFTLAYGALIEGEFVGDLICEAGSVVIGASGRHYGSITADRIYIEGTVGSLRGQRSALMGRALIAVSAGSRINADMRSRAWSLHPGAHLWGTVSTIEDGLLGESS